MAQNDGTVHEEQLRGSDGLDPTDTKERIMVTMVDVVEDVMLLRVL